MSESGETPPFSTATTPTRTVQLTHLIDGLDLLDQLFQLPANNDGEGIQLGQFRIQRRVGAGRYGVVFLAYDPQLRRQVAVKVPQPNVLADPDQRERFGREARAAARLDHPCIVPVYESGSDRGLAYLATGFVEGTTLAEWLATRPAQPDPRMAARLVELLARAIHHAHERGVLHCDLKPANVLLDPAGSHEHSIPGMGCPRVADFGMARLLETDPALTNSILIAGTPFYMPPEQASGDRKALTARADIYTLGVILFEVMCGQVPFPGDSVIGVMQQVLSREPPPPRTLVPSLPRDLETICLKCLEKDPQKRYATAEALATDLRAFLDGHPIAARAVGPIERARKWARRNPWAATAVSLACVLCVAVVVAIGDSRRQRAEELRVSQAVALVDSLATSETAEVPRLVASLAEFRELARPRLVTLARRPLPGKAGLHARLALLPDKPELAVDLAAYAPTCQLDELLPLREALQPHGAAVSPGLWALLTNPANDVGKRVRAACVLAALAPDDRRWNAVGPEVARIVTQATPGEFGVWSQALLPIHEKLTPTLLACYPESRAKIQAGKLPVSELVAVVSEFEVAASLLARYVVDQPNELAELAMIVDARHHRLISEAIRLNRAAVVPILKAEFQRQLVPDWVRKGELEPVATAALGPAAVAVLLNFESAATAMAQRKANAAAVLLMSGEAEAVWSLFAFPRDGDPTVRSFLIRRLAALGADITTLLQRYAAETDVSAKRALLLALGEFPPNALTADTRGPLIEGLLRQYREDPDSGLHSAIDWVLRQRWGKAAEVAAIDAEFAAEARQRATPKLGGKNWFVNSECQTYAVIRGPVEFTMGSPSAQVGVMTTEASHVKQVDRTFAISTTEVTVAQFLRCQPKHLWERAVSPGPETPAVGVTWYQVAAYCNWLSERQGIPRDQWCYEPNKNGEYAEGMRIKEGHLKLTGYRLPTEAEWEYACRAGSVTAWSHGRAESLTSRYAWSHDASQDRAWPVGQLRPNDLGLFDAMGNAVEWCENQGFPYHVLQRDDDELPDSLLVGEQVDRVVRGGSFVYQRKYVRSAFRLFLRPGFTFFAVGCRPARTILTEQPAGAR